MNGVLKSWAVPKGIPTIPGIKRLAIQVDDHEIDFLEYEGTIEKGEYGAGNIFIWDKGTYESIERSEKHLKFILYGNKISGIYELFYWKNMKWFLFKI
jgi:DNA ligase D-like protein (predicted 3'-phosphoesterase)